MRKMKLRQIICHISTRLTRRTGFKTRSSLAPKLLFPLQCRLAVQWLMECMTQSLKMQCPQ